MLNWQEAGLLPYVWYLSDWDESGSRDIKSGKDMVFDIKELDI